MKKLLLILLMVTIAFAMEPWEQKATLHKVLFQKELAIMDQKTFDAKKFDFFKPVADRFGLSDAYTALIDSTDQENFIKAKAKFLVDLENKAFDAKSFDFVDLMDFDENVSKEVLFGTKAKKAFIKLGKETLALNKRPLSQLYTIKYDLEVLGKPIDPALFTALHDAIIHKDKKQFHHSLKKLEQTILTIKAQKLSEEEAKKTVQSFIRYCKLTALDFGNAIYDDGSIKNNLEYTEAVVFSAKAKENAMKLAGNLKNKDFKTLLGFFDTIITDIQQKKNIKEVKSLTKKARKVMLRSMGLDDIQATPKEIVTNVNNNLNMVEAMAEKGNFKQAEFLRLESYSFFDPDIETRLKPRDPALTTELEGLFWDGYNGAKGLGYSIAHKDKIAVSTTIKQLKSKLLVAQKELESKLSYANSVVQSMMIIVREGLEAVLVLVVLLTLFSTKKDKLYLLGGALLGFLASIATYYAAKEVLTISTSNRELIEGGSALLAAIMLIFVTAWIFHNTYVKGWVAYAKELTDKSVKSGSILTLLFIGFLVVYREGFETVLFYEALAQDSYPQAVWIGFLIGLVIIVIVAILLVKGIKNLPIHLFFSVTGVLLSLLAVIFTGAGIRGLQTANILSASPSPYLKNWQFLRDYFGYSPTIETTASQITVALVLLVFYLYSKYKNQKRNKAAIG